MSCRVFAYLLGHCCTCWLHMKYCTRWTYVRTYERTGYGIFLLGDAWTGCGSRKPLLALPSHQPENSCAPVITEELDSACGQTTGKSRRYGLHALYHDSILLAAGPCTSGLLIPRLWKGCSPTSLCFFYRKLSPSLEFYRQPMGVGRGSNRR